MNLIKIFDYRINKINENKIIAAFFACLVQPQSLLSFPINKLTKNLNILKKMTSFFYCFFLFRLHSSQKFIEFSFDLFLFRKYPHSGSKVTIKNFKEKKENNPYTAEHVQEDLNPGLNLVEPQETHSNAVFAMHFHSRLVCAMQSLCACEVLRDQQPPTSKKFFAFQSDDPSFFYLFIFRFVFVFRFASRKY